MAQPLNFQRPRWPRPPQYLAGARPLSHQIVLRYSQACSRCGKVLPVGATALWLRLSKAVRCVGCG